VVDVAHADAPLADMSDARIIGPRRRPRQEIFMRVTGPGRAN
jgi:hypothetical protein